MELRTFPKMTWTVSSQNMIFLIKMYQEYYFILSPVDSKAILAVIIEWYFDVRQAYIGEKNSIKMIKHDFYLFVFF